jgi:protein-S-isoprenylcysteine O-methyltransferase Ste14
MGSRGEGWVIGQFVIGGAILVSPLVMRASVPLWVQLLGGALMVLGGLMVALAILQLGSNLTPFPKPKEDAHSLVTGGAYSIVRHPIYAGIALGAFGWSLWWGTLLGFVLAIVLFVWFDLKSRREEQWLLEKYPDYHVYQARVKKLVPFLY